MSKLRDEQESAQNTVEAINDQANSAAKSQPAKKVPDRNAWTRQQLERSNRQFDRARKDGGM